MPSSASSFEDNSHQNYANDGIIDNYGYFYNSKLLIELPWWRITFLADTTVRTVVIIPSDHFSPPTRNIFRLTIGFSPTPSDNPICVYFNVASGAYECPSAIIGRYLGIYRTLGLDIL